MNNTKVIQQINEIINELMEHQKAQVLNTITEVTLMYNFMIELTKGEDSTENKAACIQAAATVIQGGLIADAIKTINPQEDFLDIDLIDIEQSKKNQEKFEADLKQELKKL